MTTQLGTVDGDLIDATATGALEWTDRHCDAAPQRVRLERWSAVLVGLDTLAVGAAILISLVARFGLSGTVRTVDYLALIMVPGWLAVMAVAGAYDRRHIAAGPEQYRRVVNGTVWILAVAAFGSFALHANLSRAFILSSIPLAGLLTLAERRGLRRVLHRRLAAEGLAVHRVVAVGLVAEVRDLVSHMRRASYAGFRVVAAVTPDADQAPHLPAGVAWAGSGLANLVSVARQLGADTIAIAAPHLLAPGQLRRLSWELEGTEIDLVLAPAITDIAGPRIRIRPIDGLPLLCVEKPQFSGPKRLAKDTLDRVASAGALLLLSPLLLAVAIAVRLTSPGPVLYRQSRVGLKGAQFGLIKFRTMRNGAAAEQAVLAELNEHDGVLFKVRRDPRVTPVGRFCRRWSLDELPQLWNVVTGDMSLVGPRPPLPEEVERYGSDVHRRLLVKPGITGLWQVSGRSDLSWDETVRLDLHYVDNWSVGLDLVLLWKTVFSVIRGRGAY